MGELMWHCGPSAFDTYYVGVCILFLLVPPEAFISMNMARTRPVAKVQGHVTTNSTRVTLFRRILSLSGLHLPATRHRCSSPSFHIYKPPVIIGGSPLNIKVYPTIWRQQRSLQRTLLSPYPGENSTPPHTTPPFGPAQHILKQGQFGSLVQGSTSF